MRALVTVGETLCHCPTNYPTISFPIALPLSATLSRLSPISNTVTPGRTGAGAYNSACDGLPRTLDPSLTTSCKTCCKNPDPRASQTALLLLREARGQPTAITSFLYLLRSVRISLRITHTDLRRQERSMSSLPQSRGRESHGPHNRPFEHLCQ